MSVYDIFAICVGCGGDGVKTTTGSSNGVPQEWSSPCQQCGGTGKHLVGSVDLSDVENKIDDTLDKLDAALEKLAEIKALVDAL